MSGRVFHTGLQLSQQRASWAIGDLADRVDGMIDVLDWRLQQMRQSEQREFREPCPSCKRLIAAGVTVTCEAGLHAGLTRPAA
jgi:hypothetical protein